MTTRIAILGGGVMGETLLGALLRAGHSSGQLVVAEKIDERAEQLRRDHGVEVTDPTSATEGADVVLVVVKPQDVVPVLTEVAPAIGSEAVVVSLAAGITTATIESVVGAQTAVVRAMPNTPAVIGQGMFGISAGTSVTDEHLRLVRELLESGGVVAIVDESQQDAVTAVSGSGPAYVFYLAEAMIAGGIEAGLDPDIARTATIQTLKGAAALLESSGEAPAELRRQVTSPNGTTHAAITTFDAHEVKAGLAAGLRACAARSAELSGS